MLRCKSQQKIKRIKEEEIEENRRKVEENRNRTYRPKKLTRSDMAKREFILEEIKDKVGKIKREWGKKNIRLLVRLLVRSLENIEDKIVK